MRNQDAIVCPKTKQSLRWTGDGYARAESVSYPIVHGVPVLVSGTCVAKVKESLSDKVISNLLEALGLDEGSRGEISRIFQNKFQFSERWMQIEADQFLHRVAASDEKFRKVLNVQEQPKNVLSVNVEPLVSLASQISIEKCPPSTSISLNIRVTNDGTSIISSEKGGNPIHLSYLWKDLNGFPQEEGHRTPLLVDIMPSNSLTVPIFINTPERLGHFRLEIMAVHENERWMPEGGLIFNVEVTEASQAFVTPNWRQTNKLYCYMDDHFEAIRLLRQWSHSHIANYRGNFVELGGNANPMTALLEGINAVNFDVDAYGMIIGNHISNVHRRRVDYVIADGMNLPLKFDWADVIVMFATFHHFPDPVGLLKSLSKYISENGLICLMWEPLGHVHRATMPKEFEEELLKGVNEQSFELWEYQQMFEQAGLEVVECQVDLGSLKVALRKQAIA